VSSAASYAKEAGLTCKRLRREKGSFSFKGMITGNRPWSGVAVNRVRCMIEQWDASVRRGRGLTEKKSRAVLEEKKTNIASMKGAGEKAPFHMSGGQMAFRGKGGVGNLKSRGERNDRDSTLSETKTALGKKIFRGRAVIRTSSGHVSGTCEEIRKLREKVRLMNRRAHNNTG